MDRTKWYPLLAVFISVLALSISGVLYTNHVARESERKWCGMMVGLDEAYKETPPNTATGRNIAREIRYLRESFDCN
jgi:hypothetical protein